MLKIRIEERHEVGVQIDLNATIGKDDLTNLSLPSFVSSVHPCILRKERGIFENVLCKETSKQQLNRGCFRNKNGNNIYVNKSVGVSRYVCYGAYFL